MRLFVLNEKEMIKLLDGYLRWKMLEGDGVDNWSWYGEGRNETIRKFHPDHPTDDEIQENDIDFVETAQAMLDAGVYRELVQFA